MQDKSVLLAIENSGGIYNTIIDEASSNQFINLVIVNGITTNDNPQGSNSTLIAGLSISHFISGSETQTITYVAQSGEVVDFSIQSLDAGSLAVQVVFGDQTLNSTTVNDTQISDYSYGASGDLLAHSPGAGVMDIKVTSNNAPPNSMFVVGAKSNLPVQNCTVGVSNGGGGGGNSQETGEIVACVIAPIAAFATLLGAFYLWKYMHGGKTALGAGSQEPPVPVTSEMPPPPFNPSASNAPSSPMNPSDVNPSHKLDNDNPDYSGSEVSGDEETLVQNTAQNPHDKHKRIKYRRKKMNGRHHHHLDSENPCHDMSCPLNGPLHECQDPNTPCVCDDEKCILNDKEHKCGDDQRKCACVDEECPVNRERKKAERREAAQGVAITGAKAGLSAAISQTIQ